MNILTHNTNLSATTITWSFSHSDFNGKEKDYESGFHYYGARYHWSEVLTGWLSVDPLADKYPGISPYNYCAWNPIIHVDPDGMEMDNPPHTKISKTHPNNSTAKENATKASVVGSAPITIGLVLEQVSTIMGTTISAAGFYALMIPACLLFSSDSSPNQDIRRKDKSVESKVIEGKDNRYQPFAHNTKKNGKLSGAKRDRHDAQYTHGGKHRNINPNQRKGADKRRSKGKCTD